MRRKALLIVEDAETCSTTLEMALAAIPDSEILLAGSVEAALRALDAGPVDALVTDLNLPHADGFDLIERVRSDPRFARLPIVVVSGETDPHAPARAGRLGADAYFAKPYSPAAVRRKLEQLLDATPSSS